MAVQEGSASQFFLNVLLRDAGLSEKDVQVVNMKPGEAGAAFVAGRVDAAVTWEPWLSNGKTAPHGHMLVDSSQTPGLITDVLIFRRDVIERRPREIQGVVDAWNKAVAYWERNPAESNEIMARAVGDWLKDPKLFADVLTGVRFYNRPANVKFFGTPQKPGALYKVVQNALDITGGLGTPSGEGRAQGSRQPFLREVTRARVPTRTLGIPGSDAPAYPGNGMLCIAVPGHHSRAEESRLVADMRAPQPVLVAILSIGLWAAPIAGETQPALEQFRFEPSQLCLRDIAPIASPSQ